MTCRLFVLPAPLPKPGSLLLMDAAGIATMKSTVSALDATRDKSNNNQLSESMQEAWAFYQGQLGLSGSPKYPGTDAGSTCGRNFVLYIALATRNTHPADGTGQTAANALTSASGAVQPQLTLPPWPGTSRNGDSAVWADEWAKFMYQGTTASTSLTYPSITTYTIILTDGSNPDHEQFLIGTANAGGGKYFLVQLGDTSGLVQALLAVFNEVQAVNSVFASPGLPVTSNAQSTYLNQIYLASFRPDADGKPRWLGNLKQYQFGLDTSVPGIPSPFLADASWADINSVTGLATYPANTTGNSALSSAGTGFISPNAISYWTTRDTTALPDSAGGFWVNKSGIGAGYDLADGQFVEKGGVGQGIRLARLQDTYTGAAPTTARKLYTCYPTASCSTSGTALSSMPFSTVNTNLSAVALGIKNPPGTASVAASNLINWVRGEDNVGDEPSPPDPASPTLPITIRGSVHGDVLHSRPAVINYGGSIGVVVFYGANDGVFRAINGNQPPATNTRPSQTVASTAATYTPMGSCAITGNSNCKIGGVAPGGELWGFIPSEFFSKLQRLYSNSPDLLLANTPSGIVPTPTPKDYFFDGPTAPYQSYDSSGNTTGAYIFLTARRGGRVMYALDVSNPTAPKFMWKITNATSGFSELGQTWSQPKVAFVKGYLDSNSKPKPVLIFGAGYDGNGYNADGSTYLGNDDKDPPMTNTMGRGIYIVDAMTGALVWSAGPGGSAATCSGNPCLLPAMTHSIAADITTVDTDLDGYVDRLYATDTGGNIWRVDLEAGAGRSTPSLVPSTWQVTRLAALGGTVTTASTRKFLFSADVVVTKTFAAVLVGSGDREHPLSVQTGAYNTVNRFYMILDRTTGKDASAWSAVADDSNTSGAAAPSQGTLFDASTQPFNITTSLCNGTAGACKGYYLVLNQNPQSSSVGASTLGEQVVNAATTIGGFTFFGTNQPKPSDVNRCSANLGNARGYKINVLTGSGGFTLFDGGGLPPSPVGGRVAVYLKGVITTIPFLIGGGGGAVTGTVGGGKLVTCSGPDCRSSLGGQNPLSPPKLKKKRTYWNRQIDQ